MYICMVYKTRAQSTEEIRKWKEVGPFYQLQTEQQTVYVAATSAPGIWLIQEQTVL